MRAQSRLFFRVLRHLTLAAVMTAAAAADARAQAGVVESWRDAAGNWTW
jgi:hypothetical protein